MKDEKRSRKALCSRVTTSTVAILKIVIANVYLEAGLCFVGFVEDIERLQEGYCIFDIYSAGERVRFDATVYVVNFQSDFGLYDKCGYSLLGLINNRIFAGSSLQT